jgi:starch synthase
MSRTTHSKKFKIAHVAAEISPYSKVGGLGDVVHALPKATARLGHEVIIISPYYGIVRKQNLPRENINPSISVNINGADYPVSFRKVISPDGLTIYFVVNEELYGSSVKVYQSSDNDEALRWIFLAKAAIELLKLINFQPDIIHTHDWHSSIITNYLRTYHSADNFFKQTATIYTIHNLNHQGTRKMYDEGEVKSDKGTGAPPEQKNFRNYINFAKRAIMNATVMNAVSERYAREILTSEFGVGLEQYLRRRKNRLFGIINGIDYEVVNPAFDKNLHTKYDLNSLDNKQKNKISLQKEVGLSSKPNTPLLGIVNRLTEQKGFKLIMEAMPTLLKMNLQIVVVGSGRKDYLKFFREIARKHRSKVGVYSPFSEQMASRVYAGSDMYLMPSRYEPCGISQLISLRYGSIPIVRAVGGLHDTVTEFDPQESTGNGFLFNTYNKDEFLVAIARATESYKYQDTWKKLIHRGMKQSFSWDLPAKKYIELYNIALRIKSKENGNG